MPIDTCHILYFPIGMTVSTEHKLILGFLKGKMFVFMVFYACTQRRKENMHMRPSNYVIWNTSYNGQTLVCGQKSVLKPKPICLYDIWKHNTIGDIGNCCKQTVIFVHSLVKYTLSLHLYSVSILVWILAVLVCFFKNMEMGL